MNLTRRREGAKLKEIEAIAQETVDAAFHIHKELGPGLMESVYEVLLADELTGRGLTVRRQVDVPIKFRGKTFQVGFRADILVENAICLELKSVEEIAPVHCKQLLTYLRLLDYKLGFLLNFGSPFFKQGLRRIVNGLESTKYSSFRAFAASRETHE